MKIAVILGTRPETIKMTPIILECERLKIDYIILHTGQHYSYNLDGVFFDELRLPKPKYNLNIGSGTHAEEVGRALIGIEKVLQKEEPTVVLVEGDTNTVLAGAIASVKLGVKIGHVEAGLRSYDRSMPEEINRIIADHVSDLLFAPTNRSKENLLREGIPPDKVHVTGNTVVDILVQNKPVIDSQDLMSDLDEKRYFLLTLHRQENVDNKDRFKDILEGLRLLGNEFDLPILYPIHPRSKKKISEFNLSIPECVILTDPAAYFTFLKLESKARLILTDSGGVQEEACIFHVPCVTLRYNTERPETLDVGANVLAGTRPKDIYEKVKIMMDGRSDWENPFGNGSAAKQIMAILRNSYGDS